jgi:integrase
LRHHIAVQQHPKPSRKPMPDRDFWQFNAALRRLGFRKDQMTGHGFRSAASSMLNESGLWSTDAIERQLAHVDADSVRRAYAPGGLLGRTGPHDGVVGRSM